MPKVAASEPYPRGRISADDREEALRAAIGATLVLAVAMGFGRFAFTGMYPLMVRDHVLSARAGSLAASANYAGYLVGALLASRMPEAKASFLCRIALLGTVITTVTLALPLPPAIFVAVRLIAGVLSAVAMVAASVWLFSTTGSHHGAPLMFAGVGIGIFSSAELIAGGNAAGWTSSVLWIVLSAGATLLSCFAWPPLKAAYQHAEIGLGKEHHKLRNLPRPAALTIAYGLAGFGYIITATYLPMLVHEALATVNPVHIWAAFGLGAVPACFIWHQLHKKLGTKPSLALNLLVQGIGVFLPVIAPSAPGYLASALLVGGTFTGTVTIVMPAAKQIAHRVRGNFIALLTAVYGVGQIVGPLAADAWTRNGYTLTTPLGAATASLFVAAVCCIV